MGNGVVDSNGYVLFADESDANSANQSKNHNRVRGKLRIDGGGHIKADDAT